MTNKKNAGKDLLSALAHTVGKACGASDKQADALSALSTLLTGSEEEEEEKEEKEQKPRRKRGAYNRKGGKR